MRLKKLLLAFSFLVFLFCGYIVVENNIVVVDKVTINNKKLPGEFKGYKILQISDLHGRTFGKNQKRLINKINKLDYDLVLFTGDYVDADKEDIAPLEALLKGIDSDIPKYFVLGNGDEDSQVSSVVKGNKYFDLFSKYGVNSLNNIGAKIEKGGEYIWLTPKEYYVYEKGEESIAEFFDRKKETEKNIEVLKLEEEYENKKYKFGEEYRSTEEPFTINVAHRSDEIDEFSRRHNALKELEATTPDSGWGISNRVINWDISISGHTHGGQVRLPFIGAVFSPNIGMFPGEINTNGLHYYDGRAQYVSSGLGASGPKILRFRVFNPPSIGLIELQSK